MKFVGEEKAKVNLKNWKNLNAKQNIVENVNDSRMCMEYCTHCSEKYMYLLHLSRTHYVRLYRLDTKLDMDGVGIYGVCS